MLNERNLHFLQSKVCDLGSALFVSKSDAVLKMPTSIISVIRMDEVAQIWFFIPRPKQYINEFEKEFFSKLNFFKKGKDFYLKIFGKAYIITDPEEINSLTDFPEDIKKTAMSKLVLVKFRILKADYFESRQKAAGNVLVRIQDQVNQLVFNQRPGYRPYRLQPDFLAY